MIKLKKVKESDYDHKLASDMEACGVNIELFEKNNDKMNTIIDTIGNDKSKNMVSQLAEGIEDIFSKRELAFMVSKMTLVMIIQQAKQNEKADKSKQE